MGLELSFTAEWTVLREPVLAIFTTLQAGGDRVAKTAAMFTLLYVDCGPETGQVEILDSNS